MLHYNNSQFYVGGSIKTVSKDGIIPEEFISLFEKFKKAVRFNG